MTNSSPQDPQNPDPQRRKRPVGGVTFDEMIAMIVAFSTIGAILFWSLGIKKDRLASDFGLGKWSNILSAGQTKDAGIESTTSEAGKSFSSAKDLKSLELASRLSESESSGIVTPSIPGFDVGSGVKPKTESLEFEDNLTPVAGVATLPVLTTIPNTNQDTDADPTVKEQAGATNEIDSQATAPDNAGTNDEIDSQATAPDNTGTNDQTESTEVPDDVAPSYWAYPFVKQMSDQALVPEFTDDHNFEPDKLITRASMATLISQAFDMQPETKEIKKFTDVTNQNAIAADIDKAVRIGFMHGYSQDEFRPLENIPRYQVLVTLATGLGLEPSQDTEQILQKFSDGANMPDWAKQQVAAAIEAGLMVNRPDYPQDSLMPNEPATRAEVAAMIHQALVENGRLEPLESEYILNP